MIANLAEINTFSLRGRARLVEHKGIFLIERDFGQMLGKVYLLGGYIVEIIKAKSSSRVLRVNLVRKQEHLDIYIDAVDISALIRHYLPHYLSN